MFEQSLVPSPAGRKPVMMAASAGLQALAVAVLLLIPLLHSGLLPELMPHAPLTAPLALSPAPPVRAAATATVTRLATYTPPAAPVYTPPVRAVAPAAPTAPIPVLSGPAAGLPPGLPAVSLPAPAPLPGPVAPTPEKPMAIGGDVEAARCLACPPPEYPAFARQAGMQGTVELHAVISPAGAVTRVERLSGNPVLAAAALRSVRNWRYRPLLLDGHAVAVDTLITVRFALAN